MNRETEAEKVSKLPKDTHLVRTHPGSKVTPGSSLHSYLPHCVEFHSRTQVLKKKAVIHRESDSHKQGKSFQKVNST